MTPEELRKARQSVGKAVADDPAPATDGDAESASASDQQGQLSRRAEALIARQAEEAKKKQEKK